MRRASFFAFVAVLSLGAAPCAAQDARIVEVHFTAVRRAQIAAWIEHADGTFMRTLGLTQSVAVYGIGNRPGAGQMNSGYRWPYGRREGVLPVWGHRRASAPGAELFRRVIFQDRTSEGWASRTTSDFSRDNHFCLSFQADHSSMDNLDAVSCPTVFNSDKGRYITEQDLSRGYSEPWQTAPGVGEMRALDAFSIYPPRRDAMRCGGATCYDHEDVDAFGADARRIMPEIDQVTMATPPDAAPQMIAFDVPPEWDDGEYFLFLEVNTEGDYNAAWSAERFPTPTNPDGGWDFWAEGYGYPFRGQPSVVYRVPLTLGVGATESTTAEPWGYGTIDGLEPTVHEMDESITRSGGSGADRLLDQGGDRVRAVVLGPEACEANVPPGAVEGLEVTEYVERREAHLFAHLRFLAASDDLRVSRYEVRVSQQPIVDDESFRRALPALAAILEPQALMVPVGVEAGQPIEVDLGGLGPSTRYYIGVRAADRCNAKGPIAVVEYITPPIEFTTVSPCFVATAAYGTPMAVEIGALRRLRDRHLRTNALGRALVAAYETVGPHLADAIRDAPGARAWVRQALRPIVGLARALD